MTAIETYNEWLNKVTTDEKAELVGLGEKEIAERFSMPLSFGTAGMRGEVGLGTFRMNEYTVKRATYGLAKWIISLGKEYMERGVVISYDTRRFSVEFAVAAAKVLSKANINAYIFENVRPVPMCSFAVRYTKAIAGIMITASHNPKEYNGYKVYGEDGAQMSPEDTALVVGYIEGISDYFATPSETVEVGDIKGKEGKLSPYISVIGKTVDDAYYSEIKKLTLSSDAVKKYGKDLKLVYTPIHGSGYIPVTTILNMQGINVSVVKEQALPDTEFSTVPVPNPENAETLRLGIEQAKRIGATVVIGTDPDCDRMGLAVFDKEKNDFVLLNGNQIGALLLDYIIARLKEENSLPANAAVVKTIVTTTLADRIAKANGVTPINVLTGFKFIGEKIKEWEKTHEYTFLFGYEESFGYLRGTHARDKDAVVASMLTAEMVCYYESKGMTVCDRLKELFAAYGYYVELNTSVAYKGLDGMKQMADVMAKLRSITVDSFGTERVEYFADYKKGTKIVGGREEKLTLPKTDALYYGLSDGQFVCIRPSGTEPKLKVYVLVYAADADGASKKASDIMSAAKVLL